MDMTEMKQSVQVTNPHLLPCPVLENYQFTHRTTQNGVQTYKVSPDTKPILTWSDPNAAFFQYSPSGKYLAVVVVDRSSIASSTTFMGLNTANKGGSNNPSPSDMTTGIGHKIGLLHPSLPRWIDVYETKTFTLVHRLQDVSGIEEYFYFSPKSDYLVTWQPLQIPKNVFVKDSSNGSDQFTPNTMNAPFCNFKLWSINTGKVVLAWMFPKRQCWPMLRWTDDQRIAALWDQEQVQLFDWLSFKDAGLSYQDNLSRLKTEMFPLNNIVNWTIINNAIAVFQPEMDGKPAKVAIHLLLMRNQSHNSEANHASIKQVQNAQKGSEKKESTPDVKNSSPAKVDKNELVPSEDKEHNRSSASLKRSNVYHNKPSNASTQQKVPDVEETLKTTPDQISSTSLTLVAPNAASTKCFFLADDVIFRWHHHGQALLVFVSTKMDKTGKMYYGKTFLYYLSIDGKQSSVILDAEGPIHDVQWNCCGNDFAVTYGFMPSKTSLFNKKCTSLGHLGHQSRNRIIWNPHGRILCLGGFGQLPGEFDFWDTVKFKRIGYGSAYCSSYHEWTPDGRYLLAAVTWPRMRVDNCYKIFDIAGNCIWSEQKQELWKIQWQPRPRCASAYPSSSQKEIVVTNPSHNTQESQVSNDANKKASSAEIGQSAKGSTSSGGAYHHPHWSKHSNVAILASGNPDQTPQCISRGDANTSFSQTNILGSKKLRVPIGYNPVKKAAAQRVPIDGKPKP